MAWPDRIRANPGDWQVVPTWRLNHNPQLRILGCNGKPGDSGRKAHQRRKEPACRRCKNASNHAKRERNRGQPHPRHLHPCGTPAAARRHRTNNEPLDIPCQLAEAQHHADLRARKKETVMDNDQCAHEDITNQGVCFDCEQPIEGWEPNDLQIPGTYEIQKAA